ncbi:enterobactin transporter EntS [Rhodococcus globerulus]|uniref:Enterobactin transporter EntS n=1 Tax=Rhodococcus globerulus TaxID=33008 RepID=A0ABU4BNE5_RHOGO|nr:enterobactin transporter EntS [Rhodococcus globerulus]MDV6265571.1 enterobactin transporter EntS [Rhodococcus globerulus]QXW02731.1 enterobactin transporter EntS [Rhodococcus globerulus]
MTRLGGLVIDVSPLRTSRPFRYAFSARMISLLGIGLLVVAVPAQTYQLTKSTLQVAGVSTAMAIAMFVGSLFGGVLADRYDRRRTIQLARSAAGLGFVILGCNALLPHPSMWVIYVAAAIDGLAGGVSSSALMALMPALLPREKMAAAGALVALTTDVGTMISPAIAGVIIASGGIPVTYFVAAAATAGTVTLFQAVGPAPAPGTNHESPVRALVTGVKFAGTHTVIRGILISGLLVMFVSGPMVLLPAFVDDVLGGGPTMLGLLYAAPAVGAVIGSLTSGWTGRVHRNGAAMLISVALMPLGLVILGASGAVFLAFLGLAGFGLGRALNDILRFAVLQQNTPDELRGRVSSLWMVQAVTGTAIGSMAAGFLGQWLEPGTALLALGIAGLTLGLILLATLGSVRRVTSEVIVLDRPDSHPENAVPVATAAREKEGSS